ncbi:ester cyclase [Haloarchaeobius sp. TZWWS8]|uniref:ester cyclase n=1 Tax=Haloarchaeobius sp. TZWWS8 TaxID=3446121 RepID=UPI003EB8ECC7
MSTELRVGERSGAVANRILARRALDELFSRGETDVVDELFTPDAVLHLARWGTSVRGQRALRRHIDRQHEIFSDCSIGVDATVTDGDELVAHCTVRGRHTGDLPIPGRGVYPATGRRFRVPTVFRFRFEKGRIAEVWRFEDALGVAEQLGLDDRSPRAMLRRVAAKIRDGFLKSGD